MSLSSLRTVPSCYLAVPKLELEARHSPRNGDLSNIIMFTKSRNSWPGNHCPARSGSPVCSRVLPVCQHRFGLCPLGFHSSDRPNSTTMLPSKLTRQPKSMNETPKSLYNNKQQIIAKWFPISNNLLLCHPTMSSVCQTQKHDDEETDNNDDHSLQNRECTPQTDLTCKKP